MFPIRDKRGRVIGFGGRVLTDGTPKYLNSPETRIYHKGQELYGLFEAKQANKNLTRLVVVEGYMDVVALAQHGVNYAVASLGTATTPEQLQTLFRTVKEVICCYDGDRAGRDAAWRAMDNALPFIRDGYALKFVFLPDGEDPDSLIREQGQQAFETILAKAKPLSKFLFEHLLNQVDLKTLEGKASLVDKFQPYLKKLPESTLKDTLLAELASNFGMANEQQLAKLSKNSHKANDHKKIKADHKITPVRMAIALLLELPKLANEVPSTSGLSQLDTRGVPLLIELIHLCQAQPQISTAQILEHYRQSDQGKQLSKLLCWQHFVDTDNAKDVFLDSIDKLFADFIKQRTELLLQKGRSKKITPQEKQELQTLLNSIS